MAQATGTFSVNGVLAQMSFYGKLVAWNRHSQIGFIEHGFGKSSRLVFVTWMAFTDTYDKNMDVQQGDVVKFAYRDTDYGYQAKSASFHFRAAVAKDDGVAEARLNELERVYEERE